MKLSINFSLILLLMVGLMGATTANENKTQTQGAKYWVPIAEVGYFDTEKNDFAILLDGFERLTYFGDNGLAKVKKNGKWGYINTQGEMVIPAKFYFAWDFINGLAAVRQPGAKWGYINTQGEMVIPAKFDNAKDFSDNGLAAVMQNRKWGYINTQGKMVIPAEFDSVWNFSDNGLAGVAKGEIGYWKWGYINTKGKMVIPAEFERARSYNDNGLAAVKQNGKYGYINTKGEMVIPAEFADAMSFSDNGLAAVMQNRKWGYINTKGEMVIPARFDDTDGFSDNGLAAVKQNGKWGYINTKGKMVIPAQFGGRESFRNNGLAAVKQNGNWGYINTDGQFIVRHNTKCGDEITNKYGQIIWPKEEKTFELFGVRICAADRETIRAAVKESGGTVKEENLNNWGDTYDSTALLKGSSKLYISYTVDDKGFALARYTFPSRMDVQQVTRIRNMVESKYGSPTDSSGNASLGEVVYTWELEDGIQLEVSRGWPDTTTFLTYKHLHNYKLQQEEMRRQKEAREASQRQKQQSNF